MLNDILDETCQDEPETQMTLKEDETMVDEAKVKELMEEVETYRQAVRDAQDALASAEQELDEVLDDLFGDSLK